jgi:hypothetical protein
MEYEKKLCSDFIFSYDYAKMDMYFDLQVLLHNIICAEISYKDTVRKSS